MRFPDLKSSWPRAVSAGALILLEYTDFQATGDQLPQNGYDLMPSELFKRQCYLVGWYDHASLRVRDYIGTENILWSSQFPQATSTWPKTREALAKSFDGVAEVDKQKDTLGECGEVVQDRCELKDEILRHHLRRSLEIRT